MNVPIQLSGIRIGQRGPGKGYPCPDSYKDFVRCVDFANTNNQSWCTTFYACDAKLEQFKRTHEREQNRKIKIYQILITSWEYVVGFFEKRRERSENPYDWEDTFALLFRNFVWDLTNTNKKEFRQLQSYDFRQSGLGLGEGCDEHYRARTSTGHYCFVEYLNGNLTEQKFIEVLLKAARFHVTTDYENRKLKHFYKRHPEVKNWRIAYFMCGIRLFDWPKIGKGSVEIFYFREKDKDELIALGLLNEAIERGVLTNA